MSTECMRLFQPQMSLADGKVETTAAEDTVQNVMFKDRVEPYTYVTEPAVDDTRYSQDSSQAPLGEFLHRPIKIAEYDWGTGLDFAEDFDPWTLFLQNPRVLNRLTNFNLLRANLRLRFLINGNAFIYGRLITYYRPLDAFDQLSTNAAPIDQDLIAGSQCPHLYLDPNTSQGGEMLLPFFYHKNYMSITDEDWSQLGRIYMRDLTTLKHANGATDTVTVSVFAWAEDVQMSVLTSIDPTALSPQMGEFEQASRSGMISGPATMIAKVAGALSSIPMIRPYALATQMIASATATAARIFGYCRPAIIKAPEPLRPTPTASLALTNVPDTAQKLTVDDKQELTIDPMISGIQSADPLNILSIAQRESYLTKFTWPTATGPDVLLWNSRVTPTMWGVSGGTALHLTPMCVAALPFSYWTGTIKFRFQIVASNFHRGRLRFVWDPNYIVDPNTNFNVTHSTIVDISEEKDFTLSIANGQEFTLLETFTPGVTPVSSVYGTAAFANPTGANGVLGVYVLNELTSPNSLVDNDVEVNVFVSAGDDFEVFVPTDKVSSYTFKPQSGEVTGKIDTVDEETSEPSAPVQNQEMVMHTASTESRKLNTVFTGEAIASFRPLLKRYVLHTARSLDATTPVVASGLLPQFPYLRGNVSGAVNFTDTAAPYSFCNTVLLQYITMCFAGWRGSTRWKILPRGNLSSSEPPSIYVTRAEPTSNEKFLRSVVAQDAYTSNSEAAASVITTQSLNGINDAKRPPNGALGSAWTTGLVNPTMEVEVPFYSKYRFVPGKVEDYTTSSTDITGLGWYYRIFTDGAATTTFDFHVSAGDDFQTYFWTGMPRLYFEASPPTPSTTD